MPLSSAITAFLATGAIAAKVVEIEEKHALRNCSAYLPNQLQFLAGKVGDEVAGKRFIGNAGKYQKADTRFPLIAQPWAVTVSNLYEAIKALKVAEADARHPIYVSGCPIFNSDEVLKFFAREGGVRRTKNDEPGRVTCFEAKPRYLHCIDFDPTPAQKKWCEEQKLDVYADGDGAVRACVERFFPEEIKTCTYGYQFSASCGLSDGKFRTREPTHVKFHLFFWLTKPQLPILIKAWIEEQCTRNMEDGFGKTKLNNHVASGLDTSLYQPVQPHFISIRFEGIEDPLKGKRWGIVKGKSDTLDLVLTDGRNGELFGIPDLRSSSFNTASIKIGSGVDVRHIALSIISKPKGSGGVVWPHRWQDRLALMPERGTNNTTFAASRALGRELANKYGDDAGKSEDYRQACQAFHDAIEAKPRSDNSPARRAHHHKNARKHIADGLAIARAIIEQKKLRKRRVEPFYPNTEVSLAEASAVISKHVGDFYTLAGEWLQYDQFVKASPLLIPELPEDIKRTAPPRTVIAVTPGGGKTREALIGYLRSGLAISTRLYFLVPTHDKAKQIKKDLGALAAELGTDAKSSVFAGLERSCLAKKKDKPRYELAKQLAASGISPKSTTCVGCPLADRCAWLKQADDYTPGLKIIPTAYVSVAIPGFAEGKKDDPPILGAILDEEFISNLEFKRTIRFDDIPISTDFMARHAPKPGETIGDEIIPNDSERWYLMHIANAVRRLFDTEGPVGISRFIQLAKREQPSFGLINACDHVGSIVWSLKKKAAHEAREALAAGEKLESSTQAVLRRISFLYDFLQTMRTVYYANGRHDITTACKIEHAPKGYVMHLNYHRRIDDKLAYIPILHLDATTEEELCRIPFQTWDELEQDNVELDVKFVHVDIAAPHRELVKIVGCPTGKRSFDVAGTKLQKVERRKGSKRARKAADNDNEEMVRVPKAMHGNAAWLQNLRVADAICGRAVADDLDAGVISYLNVENYAKRFGLFDGVKVGHFGKVRGLNDWQNVSVLVVLGRVVPVDSRLEDEAESRFALDCKGRRPVRGLGIKRVLRGVRVVDDNSGQPNGIEIEVEEPACPLVAMVYRATTVAETVQALGRDRGVRRTASNPVLTLDFSPVLINAAYTAVIDWRAFDGLSEVQAVLHAKGVVPTRKPGHLKALAPQFFVGVEQSSDGNDAQKVRRDLWERVRSMFERAHGSKRNEPPGNSGNDLFKEISLYIGQNPTYWGVRYAWPNFSIETMLYGDVSGHKLLKPAAPTPETYREKSDRAHLPCIVDAARRSTADTTLKRALNCRLGKQASGAPRKDAVSAAALRMRALRERKKSKGQRRATKRQQRAKEAAL